MKRSLYILLVFISALILTTCKKRPELKIYNLELSEEAVVVTPYTATITVNYSYPGSIPQIKVYTSTSSSMADALETDASLDSKTITATINNLTSDTKYYYRFRYSNGINLIYTDIKDFTTGHAVVAPTVVTIPITSITASSAISGGTVTDNGGSDITEKGVCWSTHENPTIEDAHTSSGEGNGAYISNLSELSPNTLYYVRAYASNSECIGYGNELSFTTASTLASLTTKSITNITPTSANSGGIITDSGGGEITARGVCWSTLQNPTIADSCTLDGTGIGEFTSLITGLTNNVTYYVRAYATNANGTSYGDERSFTTQDGQAVLTTNEVTNITTSSATCGGEITDDGGYSITARGVCWSTNQNPTVSDSHTSNGTGTGAFTSNITGLTDNTTYYVRAYATNSKGTSYGEERTFTTIHNTTLPTVTTYQVTDIGATTATSGGYVIDDGGSTVTSRGVCWSTSPNPVLNTNYMTHDGSGTGEFISSITELLPNTTYYVRAYASNSVGTNYGEEKSFTTNDGLPVVTTAEVTEVTQTTAVCGGNVTSDGGLTVTSRGVCWSTSPDPVLNVNYMTNDGSGTGEFTSNITALSPNTTYYVRAYASNSAGTTYGEQKTFTTGQVINLPTVTTEGVSDITSSTATCGGNVTSDGGASVTARGVCWSTSSNPTIYNSHTTDGTGTGTFTSSITSLSANTTYHVRAYASNSQGTSYGDDVTFTTESDQPQAPIGAINGLFTINANGDQVYFSKGNLQYQASTNTWRFADNQWDYVGSEVVANGQQGGTIPGSSNHLISSTYNGWIDLFGWGTSGFYHGAICYQPWSTSRTNSDYYAYGGDTYNLNDQTGKADWGYNAISNGGGTTNTWRTLTKDEWDYVLNRRVTSSGKRFVKAEVNGVNGVVLLPDTWSINYHNFDNYNTSNASFSSNVVVSWTTLEIYGCIFIPAAGSRGTMVSGVELAGWYWSASYNDNVFAHALLFDDDSVNSLDRDGRCGGLSVRLVQDYNGK